MKKKNLMIIAVATAAQEDWCADHRKNRGDVPRVKTTVDADWISRHGTDQVDINTTYDLLPTDWQAENRDNAEVAISAVFDANQSGIPLDDNFVERTAETVHTEWLRRKKASNEYVSEAQGKPYSELSPEDQERDRLVVRRAVEAFETIEAEEPAAT